MSTSTASTKAVSRRRRVDRQVKWFDVIRPDTTSNRLESRGPPRNPSSANWVRRRPTPAPSTIATATKLRINLEAAAA
jgi:hypothetical protein